MQAILFCLSQRDNRYRFHNARNADASLGQELPDVLQNQENPENATDAMESDSDSFSDFDLTGLTLRIEETIETEGVVTEQLANQINREYMR